MLHLVWEYSTPFTPHLLSGSFPIQCLIRVLYLNTSHSSLLPVGHFIVTLILAVQWYMLITGCHVAIHLFVSILLHHYQSDTGNYHPHFQSAYFCLLYCSLSTYPSPWCWYLLQFCSSQNLGQRNLVSARHPTLHRLQSWTLPSHVQRTPKPFNMLSLQQTIVYKNQRKSE